MVVNGNSIAKELATLALAKSIVEGDVGGVRAAWDAGGDPEAFWIDGRVRLREFAKCRGVIDWWK